MKHALSFLAGSIFSTAFVFFSPNRPALLIFLGAALALGSVAGIIRLVGIDRTVRVLNALQTKPTVERSRSVATVVPAEAKTKAHLVIPDRSGYIKPSKKQQEQILADTIDEYLPDGLFAPPARRAS